MTRSFNALRDDVYGHFFRSQTTLRNARESLFSSATKFPFYQLNDTMRPSLVKRLTTLLNECIDPTIDYVQKNSMLPYFNFMIDSGTPVEIGFMVISAQLEELSTAIKAATDDDCLRTLAITSRKLTTSYSGVISAANDCIRNASVTYRDPINVFTRVHFVALPLINRLNSELNQCANGNSNNQCIDRYLTRNCEDETTCKVCSTM